MTDKDVLSVNMVGCAVSCSLKLLLVAFDKEVATTKTHVDAFAVEIRTFHVLATTYGNAVVALRTLTAVVP